MWKFASEKKVKGKLAASECLVCPPCVRTCVCTWVSFFTLCQFAKSWIFILESWEGERKKRAMYVHTFLYPYYSTVNVYTSLILMNMGVHSKEGVKRSLEDLFICISVRSTCWEKRKKIPRERRKKAWRGDCRRRRRRDRISRGFCRSLSTFLLLLLVLPPFYTHIFCIIKRM